MPIPLYGGGVGILLFIFVSWGLAASPMRFCNFVIISTHMSTWGTFVLVTPFKSVRHGINRKYIGAH